MMICERKEKMDVFGNDGRHIYSFPLECPDVGRDETMASQAEVMSRCSESVCAA